MPEYSNVDRGARQRYPNAEHPRNSEPAGAALIQISSEDLSPKV
jgi:hypothetical protein